MMYVNVNCALLLMQSTRRSAACGITGMWSPTPRALVFPPTCGCPQHECVYSRKVEGKPPCAPTDDRCCNCGVYVCGECTTGSHPAHGPTQGAHCCKVRPWVSQLDSRTHFTHAYCVQGTGTT